MLTVKMGDNELGNCFQIVGETLVVVNTHWVGMLVRNSWKWVDVDYQWVLYYVKANNDHAVKDTRKNALMRI